MLGDKIKKLRAEKEMTQKEFASQINISRNYLSEIETGKTKPSDAILNTIIDAFKLPKNHFKNIIATGGITAEIKYKEVDKIKYRVISDMKSLDVYKKEFDSVIEVYSDLVFQYHSMMRIHENLGYPFEDDYGKKPALVAQIESLRKDIVTYSDRLMLNPKAYQSLADNREPPKSKLADALALIG